MSKREISPEAKLRMQANRLKAKSDRAKDAVWSALVETLTRYGINVQDAATSDHFDNAYFLISNGIDKQLGTPQSVPEAFEEDVTNLEE